MQLQSSITIYRPKFFAIALFSIISGLNIPFSTAMAALLVVDNGNVQCSDTGAGNSQQPFCSISAAATRAIAGDNVTVNSGTYQEHVELQQSGTSNSPIIFAVAPGDTAIVNGQTNGFELDGASWIVIEGFNIDNTSGTGIVLKAAANIRLHNNDISNADRYGIEIKSSTDIVVSANNVSDSLGYGIYARDSSEVTVSDNHVSGSGLPFRDQTKKGIYFNNTLNSSILKNTSESNTNSGVYLSNGSSNNLIIGNTTFKNARVYVRAAPGIELRNSSNNTIEGNISYDNEDTGIQLYTGSSNNIVVNNLVYNNGDHGIDLLNSPNNRVISNTVYKNITAGINIEGTSSGTTIANNITVDNAINSPRTRGNIRVDSTSIQGATLNYNLFYLSQTDVMINWDKVSYTTLSEFQTAIAQEAMGIEGDPAWVSQETGDFHLNSSSPAIDSADASASGTLDNDLDLLSRVDDPNTNNTGNGPPATYFDRGAYEFQAGNNAPPTVSIIEPGDGASVSGVLTIVASASDLDGTVFGVQFKVDGNIIGIEDTTEPYFISWDTTSTVDGSHVLTALATDDEGATSLSVPVNVTVANNLVQLSIIASNDTYIKDSSPNSTNGSSSNLWIDNAPNTYEVLLKFNITGVGTKQITDVKLALQTKNPSNEGGDAYLITDNNWSEQTVTWNNAPGVGQFIGSLGAVSSGTAAVLDLSSIITGDGIYSIRIKALSADAASYHSKETSGLEPRILITAQ